MPPRERMKTSKSGQFASLTRRVPSDRRRNPKDKQGDLRLPRMMKAVDNRADARSGRRGEAKRLYKYRETSSASFRGERDGWRASPPLCGMRQRRLAHPGALGMGLAARPQAVPGAGAE